MMGRESLLSAPRCARCEHPQWVHIRSLGGGSMVSKSACVATIYERVQHGDNAYPCPCERFIPKDAE